MGPQATGPSGGRIEWDALLPGAEINATVVMASGFLLPEGQRVQERYRVERRLGEGGMGQVLAVSLIGTSGDSQMFALKVVARSRRPDNTADAPSSEEAARQARSFAELLRAEA